MCKRFVLLFVLAVFFSLIIASLPGFPAHAQTACNFPYSEPIEGEVAVVGQAVDSDRERFKVLNAFKGHETSVGGSTATLGASLVRHYDQIYEKTSMKKGGKFGIGPFKFGKSREFVTEIRKRNYSASFLVTFEVNLPNGKWEIDSDSGSPLTEYAQTLVSDPCRFKQIFGDSFIFQTQRGARVYVAINISFSSAENFMEFSKNMEAGLDLKIDSFTHNFCDSCGVERSFTVPAFDLSAAFSSAKGNMSKSALSDGEVELVAMQIGGDATRLGQIFGTGGDVTIASCSLDNLGNCDEAFNNVLEYLAQEEFADGVKASPEIIGYLHRSYWEVDPSITLVPEVTPEITTVRNRLAENLLEREEDLRLINTSLATSLSEGHRQQLESLKTELEREIDDLIKAGFTCFSNLESCVGKAETNLADLIAYDRTALNPNPADGRMAYFPFDAEHQVNQLINNSYPFAARLYIHENYQNGWGVYEPERVFDETPQLWLNDHASSVTVAPYCSVTLFDGFNFTGASWTFQTWPSLGQVGWNDRASSARLNFPQTTATTFDTTREYKGALYSTEFVEDRNGNTDSAYRFGGRSLIDIPENLIANNMTINVWGKPENYNNGLIVGRVSDNWDHQYMIWQYNGQVCFSIRRTDNNCRQRDGWYQVSTVDPMSLNEWSFVTGIWDGNTLKLYVNGELQAAKTDIPPGEITDCQSGTTRLGYWFDQSPNFFQGSLDDLSFYDRGLTEAEIRQLHAAVGSGINQPPLAMFTVSAAEGVAPMTVSLDAAASSDADGVITDYEWQSSSGQSAGGAVSSLIFPDPGEYSITLAITDDQGAMSRAVRTIIVASPETSPQSAIVSRNFTCYTSGNNFNVSLTATPQAANNYAIQDKPPAGWSVSNVSDGGVYDSANGLVKYGPFFDSNARTLTYTVTPPTNEEEERLFSGIYSMDGVDYAVGGASTISPCANTHPADNNPNNFSMSIGELTSYGAAWKEGETWPTGPNPVPIGFVTRAGALWKNGETYDYDPSVGNCPLCWQNSSTIIRHRSAGSSASCQMPSTFQPGEAFSLSITATPHGNVSSYAFEDRLPDGWAVSSISDGGSFDSENQKVKFGPFFDIETRTLTYQVTPPANADRLCQFMGTASFDGIDIAIAGARSVAPPTSCLNGDFDSNGRLGLPDVIGILQVLTENRTNVTSVGPCLRGDFDSNGQLGVGDAIGILQVLTKSR